jgi:hypothetical protein
MELAYQNSGFRLDDRKVTEIESKITSGEIQSLPEQPEGVISLDTSVGLKNIVLFYMLALSFGGEYGKDFGIWSDDGGRLYKRWVKIAPSTALAMIYFERHIMGVYVGITVVNELSESIVQGKGLLESDVKKIWFNTLGQMGRRFAMGQRVLLHNMTSSRGLTLEDIEGFMYELELAHEPSDGGFEGIIFLEDWREASFNVVREAYGDPLVDSEDSELLKKISKDM